tara:strand:+ start:1323 stop:1478 length:156 start_codon:yes stop_codon:yes gene_type:complete
VALYVQGQRLKLTRNDGTVDTPVINRDIVSTRPNGGSFVVQHDWEATFLVP